LTEIVQPILVGDIRKIFGFIDTEVVHQDISLGNLCDELLGSFCRAEIRFDYVHIPRERGDGFVYLFDIASRNGDLYAFLRQQADDGQADACGAAGDDSFLSLQL
jgi:hypothetical protein